MKLKKFQRKVNDILDKKVTGSVFFLCEEVGEVAKILKQASDSGEDPDLKMLEDEMGDVLTALASLANSAGLSLKDISKQALDKWTARSEEEDK